MAVALPVPEWPRELLAAGPPEDPSILLRGEAVVAGTKFVVSAVRIDPIRFGADYLPDLNTNVYAEYALSAWLDAISELTAVSEMTTIPLGTGRYIMWMLPDTSGA